MTKQYIEHKLKDTSNEVRDFLAWNSIRGTVRLQNSPHLRLQKRGDKIPEDDDMFFENGEWYSKSLMKALKL